MKVLLERNIAEKEDTPDGYAAGAQATQKQG